MQRDTIIVSTDYAAVFPLEKIEEAQTEAMQGVDHLKILVFVAWRYVNAALDGQELEDEDPNALVQEWHFLVYDGTGRPAGWAPVQHGVEVIAERYRPTRVKHVGAWSDGCAAQYKSRTPFLGFTILQAGFAAEGLQLSWQYYGSQRGK